MLCHRVFSERVVLGPRPKLQQSRTSPLPLTPRHPPPSRLVQGLRPWISAPCSLLLCAAADRFGIHRPLLIACFTLSAALRGSLALVPPSFAAVAGVILLADAVASPVAVIADSSVVAKCKQDGDYGKQRCVCGVLVWVLGVLRFSRQQQL